MSACACWSASVSFMNRNELFPMSGAQTWEQPFQILLVSVLFTSSWLNVRLICPRSNCLVHHMALWQVPVNIQQRYGFRSLVSITELVTGLNNLTLCLLGNFAWFCVACWFFFKINFFEKFFQEYLRSGKQFGSRSGPTFRRAWAGSKLFAKVISRRH